MSDAARSAVVLGARNTGGAITDRLLADGWRVTAVARSEETVRAVRDRGARAVRADAADPDELHEVLADARAEQGGLDLVVNATAPRIPPGPFGGGPVADADLAAFRAWAVPVAEQTFTFLHTGTAALRPGGGTLVQLTGGSSLRARAGSGLWAAGAFATRALVHAAANELREDGIHVALVVIDGTIGQHDGTGPGAGLRTELDEIAAAVAFLAAPGQVRRTHEIHLSRQHGYRPA
ncbi:SDR family oxidoreductase [Planosporangium sp. 12N6]|uniref:SDR family oxidoreductase n=1 Tax=Planosporangium spinosum TaxID=3402278 RepID=UPI003CFBAACE